MMRREKNIFSHPQLLSLTSVSRELTIKNSKTNLKSKLNEDV